ncbi:MAG: SGNH/GDSL hydrolase family protein [Verrucomicrobiota bacterium]
MIGDSITDCGRSHPAGEGLFDALGKGYVCFVDALVQAIAPEQRIRIINRGLCGNTIRDLKARWREDVLDLKPDWVSVMIGINDVWRQFDSPLQAELIVLPCEYEAIFEELIQSTLPRLKGMVIMTPYFIEPNRSDPMRTMMDHYGAICRRLAEKYGTHFVDTQSAFDAALEHLHPMSLAWDRVHPVATGHMILARSFLRTVGFGLD